MDIPNSFWRSLRPTTQASAYLKEIKDAGERAASLTRQLLAFSRRQVLAPQVLDLNAVVSNLEKMLRRLIGEDIKLHTVLDPSLGRVKADPGQIEQVIMNLAVNARDAMPAGGTSPLKPATWNWMRHYARSHATVKPGPHVMLAVSDTGVGMTPETQGAHFRTLLYHQGKGQGDGPGTGHRVRDCQTIGRQYLGVQRTGPGHRLQSIFSRRQRESGGDGALAKAETDSASGTETILVVEDEEGVRSLIRLALESAGYKVLETERCGKRPGNLRKL